MATFKKLRSIVSLLCLAGLIAFGLPDIGVSQSSDDTLESPSDAHVIPITIDNFVRAASDIEFDKYAALAGGVNRFFHFRTPTPIDNQPTIRMNRDTLYSTSVVDISAGATLSLPDAGDRYMTAMVVNQDHFVNEVFFGGGTFDLDKGRFDTPYVLVFVRILVDADDPVDVSAVNALQDAMSVTAGSEIPFSLPAYDPDSFKALLSAIIEIGRFATSSLGTFGTSEDVLPLRHFLGTAVGWGGLPEEEAYYLNIEPRLPVGSYRIEVPADVPVNAFWSVSLYNSDGFFEPNDMGAYVVNSVSGARNKDGSMSVHFGACDDGRVNGLPLMEGWNYTIRLYQPEPAILDGSWSFPEVQLVK
ncbi:MAG: DUF1214 domain-containing protein [Pseudomonadota bacterium]